MFTCASPRAGVAGDVLPGWLGWRGIRFHDLRHTHASLLLLAGVYPKIVQERLGHSTVAITLDIYSHTVSGLQVAAACRYDEMMEAFENPQKKSAKCRQKTKTRS